MRQRQYNLATALLLAWLFVIQPVAGSIAAAQPTLLDAFGNPLCINNSVSITAPRHDKGNPLDCCMVDCYTASFAAPSAPDETAFAVRLHSTPAFLAVAHVAFDGRQSRHEPGNP